MERLRDLSLTQQVLLTLFLPIVVLSAATSALFLAYGTHPIDLATRERGLAIASFLAPAAEYAVISGNNDGLDGILSAALAQDGVAAVAVVGADGALLARRGDIQRLDHGWLAATQRPRVFADHPGRLVFAAPVRPTPIALQGSHSVPVRAPAANVTAPSGWVYVELDTRPLEAARRNVVLTALLLAIGVLALAAIPAVRLAHRFGDPVARLADAVSRVAAGQLDVPIPACDGGRELQRLEKSFSSLSASIAAANRKLEDTVGQATAQLEYQALHDPLTGMLNRRAFEKALEEVVLDARRTASQATLCFVDLDYFKEVNDACGHAAGDALLQDVATLFGPRVRAGDAVYRIGGDEFAIILRGCTPHDARRIAEGLCTAIGRSSFTWRGQAFRIGASIGLARIDDPTLGAAALLEGADAACYRAKRRGRNCVVEHCAVVQAA